MAAREPENGDGGADPENLFGGGTGIEIRKTPAAVRLRAFVGYSGRFKTQNLHYMNRPRHGTHRGEARRGLYHVYIICKGPTKSNRLNCEILTGMVKVGLLVGKECGITKNEAGEKLALSWGKNVV